MVISVANHVQERERLPVISRFLGIVIAMYYDDHSPPHFHARTGDYEIKVEIQAGTVDGRFPSRALHHVLEWYTVHQSELLEDWELCRRREAPRQIEPLE